MRWRVQKKRKEEKWKKKKTNKKKKKVKYRRKERIVSLFTERIKKKKKEKEGRKRNRRPRARQVLGKAGRWLFLFLLLGQNSICLNAAAEGPQKRTEMMERWRQQEVKGRAEGKVDEDGEERRTKGQTVQEVVAGIKEKVRVYEGEKM